MLCCCRDPRHGGGKVNSCTKTDAVKLINIEGQDLIWYRIPKINVALLRATTADTNGNISFESEVFYADCLYQVNAIFIYGQLMNK